MIECYICGKVKPELIGKTFYTKESGLYYFCLDCSFSSRSCSICSAGEEYKDLPVMYYEFGKPMMHTFFCERCTAQKLYEVFG